MVAIGILGVGNALHAPVDQLGAFLGVQVVQQLQALVDLAVFHSGGGDDGGLASAGIADHGVVVVIGVGLAIDALHGHHAVDHNLLGIAIALVGQGLLDGSFVAAHIVGEAEEHANLVAGDLGGPGIVLLADEFLVDQAFVIPLAHGFHIGLEVGAVVVLGPVGGFAGLGIAVHDVDLAGESSGQVIHAGMHGAPPVAGAEGNLVAGITVAVGVLLLEGSQHSIQLVNGGRHFQVQTVQPVLADGIAPVSAAGDVGLPVAEGDDGAVVLGHGAAHFRMLLDHLEPVRNLLLVLRNLADGHDHAVFHTGQSAAGILRPVEEQQIRILAGHQHRVHSGVVVVRAGGSQDGQLDAQAVLQFLEPQGIGVIGNGVAVQFLAEVGDFHGFFRDRHGGEGNRGHQQSQCQNQGQQFLHGGTSFYFCIWRSAILHYDGNVHQPFSAPTMTPLVKYFCRKG